MARGYTATRGVAAIVVLVGLTVLGIALWLRPDPRGLGTHQQLGTGPCGALIVTGYPCPTCGMTTAFAYLVRGNIVRSFAAQPGGLVLGLATIAAVLGGGWALVLGRWPPLFQRIFREPFWSFLALLIVILAGWGYTVAAGLIRGTLPYR